MVVKPSFVPERGDAIWIDFGAAIGHEQARRRPAVVLSSSIYNGVTGLAVLCPITSRSKNYPYEVDVPAGLDIRGVVLADQVKNMAWKERAAEFICSVPDDVLVEISTKLGTLLRPLELEDQA